MQRTPGDPASLSLDQWEERSAKTVFEPTPLLQSLSATFVWAIHFLARDAVAYKGKR
ncbi:hypothetical protein PILCRDRAFT_816215 [Piloderma croceum F 1598]|uniref:Uncharacterized protein n=1 Tax=Piloderma croceum (strain F 1598) TaxID=765440 RepID=A0A0C3G6G8_PILCF|nr:hypothetical protein PILCRDRAFT_816215 [Piloderma croceum F 1598]